MAKEKLKYLKTAFTPEGDYLAILSTDGTVKVWNTSNGTQLAEWKDSNEDLNVTVLCLACSFKGKKRRKERSTCLVAFGTDGGDISVLNISTAQILWKSTVFHPSGTAHLSFTKNGRGLYAVGTSGIVHEMNSDTGELTRELKISKKSISLAAFLPEDDKVVTAVGNRIQVFSLEDGKELLKFSSISGPAKYVSASGDAKFIAAAGFAEKQLQVWKCDFSTSTTSSGPVLSMKHSPLFIECKNGRNGEDGLVVLSVLETGVAYLWNLKYVSEEVNPTKITVKASSSEAESREHGRSKKNRIFIIAAKVHDLATDRQVRVLVVYGSVDSPQFRLLDVTSPGEDIVITSGDDTIKEVGSVQDNGVHVDKGVPKKKEKGKNKRDASDLDSLSEVALPQAANEDSSGVQQVDYDLNEPTMGEKLANLNLAENNEAMVLENTGSSPLTKPPSADSVHVLLRQALHADDRALLVDCLYRQEEKVVANSVAQLNPSDVLKLLQSLTHIIQSRGGVVACALPWLRSLLLQHASSIMSQESSLLTLNSLYQLIESRISTFDQAVKLSSGLEFLYAGNVDEGDEESDAIIPYLYEDKDESDEEEEDAMDTESGEENEKEAENLSGVSDFEDME